MIEIEKSGLPLSRVDRIHHISDIHIRNYKRHAEYNRVFENLYAKIKSNLTDNDLIVLTGDIVHSKTDVTPELFNEVQKFFNGLCNIAPVLMIPGNHDANLNNSHRLDALTPIVNALSNPRLQYCKDTTILRLANVDFYHWSVFDEKKNYPLPFEDSQTRIALFHGPVNNSITEAGFKIENDNIKVDDFKGFDLVLLGDIHKTQFLNPQKTIAYPGSLIQQNHGEEREHGYLLWEVESHFVEFVKIDNDTAFYTVEVDNGNYKSIDETLPENLYLRVKFKNTDQSTMREVVNEVKKQKNVLELATQRISTFSSKEKTVQSSKGIDFRSVEQQRDLITKFLKQKHNLKDEDLTRVLEINDQVNRSLKKNEVPRNSMWIPKRFEFENMFSYGKGNYVDFTDMKGTYGMFAPNASGKSTLLDSLTYCLFDKCTKTSRGHQVLNSNSNTFYCKLNFELNGLDYYIERSARKQSNGNVRVEVDFYYVNESGEKVSMNGKDRADTNANIRNILGTYEDFVLTTLSTQTNNSGFIDMNQKDRKDLLSQFMDIGVFEELFNIANETAKENAAVLRHFQKTDYETKLCQTEKKLEDLTVDLEKQNIEKDFSEKERIRLNNKLEELVKQLDKVDTAIIDEETINKNLKDSKERLVELKNKRQSVTNELHSLAIEIDDLNFRIDSVDEVALKEKLDACKSLSVELGAVNLERQKLSDHISHKLDKMGKLKELEYDPDCKYCMGNIFVKDAIAAKEQITSDREKLKSLEDKQKLLSIEVSKCVNVDSLKESYEDNKRELMKLKNKSSELSLQLEKINGAIIKEDSTIKDYENKLELRNKQLSSIKKNEITNKKIEDAKKDLKIVEAELKVLNSTLSDTNAEVRLAEKSVKDLKNEIAKRKELEASHQFYQYYLEATHRDGIPHDIISVTIPQIEDEVNNILSQLVDFKIIFETDDKNVNAYIAYSEDKFWSLELTSGMEKFVSSLAIRTALINISTLPRPNFIAIDEGFGSLDKGNLGSMSLLFEYLKTQFKFIMVVSHIGSMRDVVDDHIEIHKVDGRSSVMHG
jgi:DNA repair exonuclease SbcCD ATPase subunit